MIWSYHVNILEQLLCARKTLQYQSPHSKGLTYTAHSYLVRSLKWRNKAISLTDFFPASAKPLAAPAANYRSNAW